MTPAISLVPIAASTQDGGDLVVQLAGRANLKFPDALVLPLRDLVGSSRAEFWKSAAPTVVEQHQHFRLYGNDQFLFGQVELEEQGDIAACTQRCYEILLAHSRRLGYPHLLRLWNFFGAITEGEGDDERYRQFVIGRARVIDQAPEGGYAAATAIGQPAPADQLHVLWLASRQPGIAIENPRQTPAYHYPRDYGPVAPGFSRAMLVPGEPPLLLISGTASIVGHHSQHHDTLAQIEEIFDNLGALIESAESRAGRRGFLARDGLLRVYLRDAGEAALVREALRNRLGVQAAFLLLHGDVCRPELRVEIEVALPLRDA